MIFSYKRLGFVKLYTGFLIVIGLSFVGAVYSFMTANKDKEIIGSVNQKFLPYLEDLERFDLLFVQSKMYITNWVFLQYSERDKEELKKIHSEKYPILKKDLERSVENLAQFSFDDGFKDKDSLAQIFKRFERLLQTQKKLCFCCKILTIIKIHKNSFLPKPSSRSKSCPKPIHFRYFWTVRSK